MTGADVIRKATDCGYSIIMRDDQPHLRGPKPINPPTLIELCKAHRTEIAEELRRRKEGQRPKADSAPSSAELQRWMIALVKSGRGGMVMIGGVPVGVREEAESLLSDQRAWERHDQHHQWKLQAVKLRAALEWPVED